MSFLDDFTKKVSELSGSVMEKTKTSTENLRLNKAIGDEEKSIAQAYQEIGRKYRQLFGENPLPEFADLLAEIERREAVVAEYRSKVQQNRGKVPCAGCGTEIAVTSAFCPTCGAKNEYQPPKPVEPTIPEEVPAEKTCISCGTTIPAASLFCTNCGARQDVQPPADTAPAEDAPASAE